MSLPVYQHITIKNASLEDLGHMLHPDMNLKHPVVINVKALDLDAQREIIGLIENYFSSNNLSYKFPYPIYLLSDHEVSITKVPLVHEQNELPKFYTQRESKMNVKETHLAGKNKLLQQEVKNCDTSANSGDIENYGFSHRIIFELEQERKFYRSILNKLQKAKKIG
jgi:hypothetical protein